MQERYFIRTRWREVGQDEYELVAMHAGIDPGEMKDDDIHTQAWQGTGWRGVHFIRLPDETDEQFDRRIQVHFHGEDVVAYAEKLMGKENI